MLDTVKICGITHKIVECEDKFDVDVHFGQIDYKRAEILINKDLSEEQKAETLCHEILHGILVHLGYQDQSNDEVFVQGLANAINQTFRIKEQKNEEEMVAHDKQIRAEVIDEFENEIIKQIYLGYEVEAQIEDIAERIKEQKDV